MNAEQLSKVGSDLVRRCGTRDPFQIAKELGMIAKTSGNLKECIALSRKIALFS